MTCLESSTDAVLGRHVLRSSSCDRYRKHDDVIKWKHFQRYRPFVQGIDWSPVNSPHKGQWRGVLRFSLICAFDKRLSKQSWGWWFKTPSRSLWRHCNIPESSIAPADNAWNDRRLSRYKVYLSVYRYKQNALKYTIYFYSRTLSNAKDITYVPFEFVHNNKLIW